jgi:protein O-mannosyl-transferase
MFMRGSRAKKRDSQPGATKTVQLAPGMLWLSRPSIQVGLILLVGLGLYLPTLNAPFLYDDFGCVKENPIIRNFIYFLDFDNVRTLNFPPDLKNNFALRPVAYLTFSLNYIFGGLHEFGCHLVNTAIHLFNALLVYLLATVTLQRAPLRESGNESFSLQRFLPLLVALLFVAHPLQTQAVTYITQRITSFATLLYLLALLLYIGARIAKTSRSRWGYYGGALATTLLAMKTKEIAFTLPVIMLLYDFFFLDGTLRSRCRAILPFLLTMAVIPATLIWLTQTNNPGVNSPTGLSQSLDLVNFAQISRWDYLITQFGVLTTYLRMFILPLGQNLDHDYRLARSFWEWQILGSFLFLLFLFGGAVLLAIRSFRKGKRNEERLVAFGILWFFVTLSVESTLIPIDDLLVEHRLYLPSFGIFLAVAVAATAAVGRGLCSRQIFLCSVVLAVGLLSAATVARNYLYLDDIRMLEDVIAKSPDKPRVLSILGTAYFDAGRFDEAIVTLTRAVQLRPDNVNALGNLGCAYYAKGQFEEATRSFQRAIELAPDNYQVHASLGVCYFNEGRVVDAEREYRRALAINPNFGDARKNLARLYTLQGRSVEAIAQYRTILAFEPQNNEAILRLQQLGGQ